MAVTFVAGGALVLERRCLGQMAIVQPLVVCLLAGWLSGRETTGLWVGISLQLFSTDRSREIDWPLSGVIAAAVVLFSKLLGISFEPGEPGALTVLMASVLAGLASRSMERKYAKADGEQLRSSSPWTSSDPVQAIEKLVRRVVIRWILIGGLEVVIGTSIALFWLFIVSQLGLKNAYLSSIIAAATLAFAAGVALSSISKKRFVAWAGLSMAISWAVFV
jgi:hypothetical protein